MAIYSQWGHLTIAANCGQCQPGDFARPVTLVAVLFDEEEDYQFSEYLMADGGTEEIRLAVEKAPLRTLDKEEMKKAISRAL